MSRIYKDLIVGEADGKPRLTFRSRDGAAVLQDVTAELSSAVQQQGDRFGARAANELLMLDDSGVPFAVAPDFTAAEAPAALVPREKMSAAFAKIAAAISVLGSKAEKNGTYDAMTVGNSKKLGGKTLTMSLSGTTLSISYK